jgi:hypothetical protein
MSGKPLTVVVDLVEWQGLGKERDELRAQRDDLLIEVARLNNEIDRLLRALSHS